MEKEVRDALIVKAALTGKRVSTPSGVLGVDGLFTLPMKAINETLAHLLGEQDKMSRLKNANTTVLDSDVALLEAISDTRDENSTKNARRMLLRQKQGKLMEIRRRQDDAAMEAMDSDELDAAIAEMSKEISED
jgi:hypothetical protein